MKFPKELTTVTPLSKYLAIAVFIAMPFLGFFLGIRYQEMLNLAKRQEMGANLAITRTPTPTPIPIPTTDPSITANWKTYANKDYGFELRYPTQWKPVEVVSGSLNQALYEFQTPDGKVGFEVFGVSYVGSLDEYFSTQRKILSDAEGASYILSEVSTITVGGQSAIKIPNRSLTGNYESILIFVKNGTFVYRIDFPLKYEGDPLFDSALIDKEKASILDQILSTFRFVKQKPVIPTDKVSCEAKGGTWGQFGLLPVKGCVLPTSDAGESCTDSSQCESVCVADDKILPDTKTTGKCYDRTQTLGTCLNYVLDGKAQGTICAD